MQCVSMNLSLRVLVGDLKEEIKTVTIRISEYPKAWPVGRGEVRRCLLHKFPYKLLYSIENQIIGLVESNHNKAILPPPKSGAANLNEVHNSQPVSSSCLKIHKNVLSVRVGF